jgi:DNA-binding IclR family transcriptional regulator
MADTRPDMLESSVDGHLAKHSALEPVKSARRAVEIIDLLTRVERPLAFIEFVRHLGYPRSSLYGILHTLVDAGWLDLDAAGKYALGLRAYEAGSAYLRMASFLDRAMPIMQDLRDSLQETVQLAVLDGRFNVYIGKVDGPSILRLDSAVGRRLPAHATGVGKALLAELSNDELEERLGNIELEQFTPSTIVDLEELKSHLAETRRRGYAVDDQESIIGVRCFAAPVKDATGRAVASMSVAMPTVRLNAAIAKSATKLLLEKVALVSMTLGYQPRVDVSPGT